MADLAEFASWTPKIIQLDLQHRVIGGSPTFSSSGVPVGGFANIAAQQLANRTLFLRDAITEQTALLAELQSLLEATEQTLVQHIGSGEESHAPATQSEAGFMSAADKVKLDAIEEGADVFIETNLGIADQTATNLLITSSTGSDAILPSATTTLAGLLVAADKTKLDTVASGAEVNQNAFSSIAVTGQTTVAADSKTDTLTLVGGSNVTITTDAATDTITITAATASSFTLAQAQATALSF